MTHAYEYLEGCSQCCNDRQLGYHVQMFVNSKWKLHVARQCGAAAASLYVTYSLLLCLFSSCCYRIAALPHQIHCCCQQTTHSSTLTANSAPDLRSAHRRKHRCLRQHAFLPAPASPGAFLQDSPCPTGFRSKCNTTSVLPESLRRTPTHLLRYGSGKHC